MHYIVHFLAKEHDRTLLNVKKRKASPLSEAFYKELPRVRKHLLTPLGRRLQSDCSQHPSHTGEQQLKLCQFFFSRVTRNKWQQPLTIRFCQRLNPFSHG